MLEAMPHTVSSLRVFARDLAGGEYPEVACAHAEAVLVYEFVMDVVIERIVAQLRYIDSIRLRILWPPIEGDLNDWLLDEDADLAWELYERWRELDRTHDWSPTPSANP